MSQGPDVAVIGGSGFIGARMVESLANRGSSVRVLSRSGWASGSAFSSVRSLRGGDRRYTCGLPPSRRDGKLLERL
jgi:uncharacterized protein YbjT (DUF2867 family)